MVLVYEQYHGVLCNKQKRCVFLRTTISKPGDGVERTQPDLGVSLTLPGAICL